MMLGLMMINSDRAQETDGQSHDRARRVESPPENAQHDDRQIRARRHRKGEPDQKRDVDRAQLNREHDRDRADDERGDPRHAHFFTRPPLAAVMDDVRVEIVREARARTDR